MGGLPGGMIGWGAYPLTGKTHFAMCHSFINCQNNVEMLRNHFWKINDTILDKFWNNKQSFGTHGLHNCGNMLSLAIFGMKCWKCNILLSVVEWHEHWQMWRSVCHGFQEKSRNKCWAPFRFMKCDQEVLMKKLLPQIMCLWRSLTVWSPMPPCQTVRSLRFKLCVLEILWQFGLACCHSKDLYRYIFEWWFKLFHWLGITQLQFIKFVMYFSGRCTNWGVL